jgi:hypothetical protein
MKKLLSFLMVAFSFASHAQVNYVSSVEMDLAHRNYTLDQAVLFFVPTRTVERTIPGCNPGGEAGHTCTETVVLESQPVVQVYVDYEEGVFRDPEMPKSYLVFQFPVSDFDQVEIGRLANASPMWRLRGGAVRRNFAKNNFRLQTQVVSRDLRVVDTRRSRLCPVGESGEPMPGCVENIVYKTVSKKVRQVSLVRK